MVIGVEEMDRDTFLTKVCQGWRVTIYETVRESLGLEVGDIVRITIRKNEAKG